MTTLRTENNTVTETEQEQPTSPRFRFSLNAVILWIAIFALILTNVMTYREVLELKSHLKASPASGSGLPISAESVAKQFVQATNMPATLTTKVNDVRYSPKEDAYLVDFAWKITATGQTWHSDVRLTSDGFGSYYGKILSDQFNQPLNRTQPFSVIVSSPSPLTGNP